MTKPPKPIKRLRIDVLGVLVDDVSEKEAVAKILKWAKSGVKGKFVATINVEFVMLARRNEDFKKVINNADLGIVDSSWLNFSKLMSGGKVKSRVTGVDLLEKICSLCADLPIRIGFLGGFGNVAKIVWERQKVKNPKIDVVFAESGNPDLASDLAMRRLISAVGRVDVLFVAYGMGKQEYWIARNKKFLNVGVFVGVGGAFDMISGKTKRAPGLLRNNGLEFVWRLILEPTRIWRMRVLPIFLFVFWAKYLLKRINL